MKPLSTLALLASLTLAPGALAAAETPPSQVPQVFATVDDYAVINPSTVEVTGILQGETLPRVFRFIYNTSVNADSSQHLSRCDRLALLAMNRPGRYVFEMTQGGGSQPTRCRLTRQ
ncbi:hypothetical protein G4177_20630 [Corallococcus sp. ZKHCc1 1396]|uniref:Uncharacterized protein n=1 Tax=Corallococcus soli TaxID=2710757 RepID=A0ABR9PRM0_9BACT|nr:hypothetical protein [Corallococcus soli]MBE4750578.1 hypothetical protein [Corallococcus soli]RYZ46723.1 MAG: hypothetical protein EOO72_01330 [Myxococcaceae bacterium]